MFKKCKKCNENKPFFDFGFVGRQDKYKDICKKCSKNPKSSSDLRTMRKSADIGSGFTILQKRKKPKP